MADAPPAADAVPCDADESEKPLATARGRPKSFDIWKLIHRLPAEQKQFEKFCAYLKPLRNTSDDWKRFSFFYGNAWSEDLITRLHGMMAGDINVKTNIFYIGLHIQEIRTGRHFVIVGISNMNVLYLRQLDKHFSIADEELLDRNRLAQTCRSVHTRDLLLHFMLSCVTKYGVLGDQPVRDRIPLTHRQRKRRVRKRKAENEDQPVDDESTEWEVSEDDQPKRTKGGKRNAKATAAAEATPEEAGSRSADRGDGGEPRARQGRGESADALEKVADHPDFLDWIANLEANRLAQLLVQARADCQSIVRRMREELKLLRHPPKSQTNLMQGAAKDEADAGAKPDKDDVRGDRDSSTRRLPLIITSKKTRAQGVSENYLRVWDNVQYFEATYKQRIKYRDELTAERLKKQRAEEQAWKLREEKKAKEKEKEEPPEEKKPEEEPPESESDESVEVPEKREPLRPFAHFGPDDVIRNDYADVGELVEPSTTFDAFMHSAHPNVLVCRLLSVGGPSERYAQYLGLPTKGKWKYRFYFIANLEVWNKTSALYERDLDLGPCSNKHDHNKFFFTFMDVEVTQEERPTHREDTLKLYRGDTANSMKKWDKWCRNNVKDRDKDGNTMTLHDAILNQLHLTDTEGSNFQVFIFPACFLPVCSTEKPKHDISCQCGSGMAMNPFDAPICEYYKTRRTAYLGLLLPLHWIDFCKLGPLCYFFKPPYRVR